jgi:hypothetical protein
MILFLFGETDVGRSDLQRSKKSSIDSIHHFKMTLPMIQKDNLPIPPPQKNNLPSPSHQLKEEAEFGEIEFLQIPVERSGQISDPVVSPYEYIIETPSPSTLIETCQPLIPRHSQYSYDPYSPNSEVSGTFNPETIYCSDSRSNASTVEIKEVEAYADALLLYTAHSAPTAQPYIPEIMVRQEGVQEEKEEKNETVERIIKRQRNTESAQRYYRGEYNGQISDKKT